MSSDRIISPRKREVREEYSHVWEWKSTPGAGFSFPSDKNGNVQVVNLNDAAKENYMICLINKDNMLTDCGVERYEYVYIEYAILKCKCGRKVELNSPVYGTSCDCGRLWSDSGYEMAPMSQWEDRMDDEDYHTVAEYNGGYDA